ncbi:hypothetical protein [Nonomuraea guangzhouensis]|uniref:Integral membrane protein n=1 Tax=Nonomuraea guangzhouensis TaxID=1291555 RepID=A0ABW4GYQ2_9ACTN|nr:hypothetical protein [Nonomuraea guangzhouensis]
MNEVNELLEQRYRTVLRLLPRSYRAEREEEMVAAFMEGGEVSDEDNPRPGWGEIASVLALSTRVRLGGAGAIPRFVVWGAAVRLVATLGLAFHAAAGAFTLTSLAFAAPGSMTQPLGVLAAALWVPAFVLMMRGHVRTAKPVALAAGAAALAELAAWQIAGGLFVPLDVVSPVLNVVVPLAALFAGFHGDVPPVRRAWPPTLLPLAAGLVLRAVVLALLAPALGKVPLLWPWLDLMGLASVVLVVAGIVCLGRRLPPYVPLALAILGTLMLPSRLSVVDNSYLSSGLDVLWASSVGQCVALVVMVVLLAVAGFRGLPAVRRGQATA